MAQLLDIQAVCFLTNGSLPLSTLPGKVIQLTKAANALTNIVLYVLLLIRAARSMCDNDKFRTRELLLRFLLLCFVYTFLFSFVFALDRDRTLTQFHHTAWTAKDGAPSQISALAQTQDGYLWIGSARGL